MLLLLISQQVTNSFLLSILSDFKDRWNAIRRIHSSIKSDYNAGKILPKVLWVPPWYVYCYDVEEPQALETLVHVENDVERSNLCT